MLYLLCACFALMLILQILFALLLPYLSFYLYLAKHKSIQTLVLQSSAALCSMLNAQCSACLLSTVKLILLNRSSDRSICWSVGMPALCIRGLNMGSYVVVLRHVVVPGNISFCL